MLFVLGLLRSRISTNPRQGKIVTWQPFSPVHADALGGENATGRLHPQVVSGMLLVGRRMITEVLA